MNGTATFGNVLRQHRFAARLTQAQLAERAGLSERAISDLERGLKSPQRATLHLLIDALRLPPDLAEAFQLAARSQQPTTGQPALISSPDDNNLPAPLTSFVGRKDQIARLQQLLDGSDEYPTRLVTLTGTGGAGKTRLAIEVARRVLTAFPDGVWFADLSSIADPRLLPTALLTAIGGRESSDHASHEALLHRVQGRRMLLVLDNCEHLIQACAELVEALVGSTSDLRVLATSREALKVPSEVAWRVPSLPVPDADERIQPDQVLEYDSVRLFVDRATRVEPDFSVGARNAAAVAQVCRRLDGIPLALELAAARSAAMSIEEIASRLDDSFHLLTSGSRTALERQRTLRAAIDWSHDLLPETERVLFRRLAVFAGGWTLEAAEVVCADDRLPRAEILPTLLRLVDQSLVAAHVQDARTRYRFLEAVRAYASEKLLAADEPSAVQARHRAWCLDVAERGAEGLVSPDHAAWFRLLTLEHDNMRAALDGYASGPTASDAEVRLVAALGRFWFPRKPAEGRRRLAFALDRAPAPSIALTEAQVWLALLELYFGDASYARELLRAATTITRELGRPSPVQPLHSMVLATEQSDAEGRLALLEEAAALEAGPFINALKCVRLGLLGAVTAEAGDTPRARSLLEESEALAHATGGAWFRTLSTPQLGWLCIVEGRLDEAEAHFRAMVDLGADWGGYHTVPGLIGLGQVVLRRGDLDTARAIYRQLLVDLRRSEPGGSRLASALVYQASVEEAAGLHAAAQRLIGASEAWHAARGGAGWRWSPNVHGPLSRGLVPLPPAPTEPLLVQALAEGRAMSLDEAVAFALEEAVRRAPKGT